MQACMLCGRCESNECSLVGLVESVVEIESSLQCEHVLVSRSLSNYQYVCTNSLETRTTYVTLSNPTHVATNHGHQS